MPPKQQSPAKKTISASAKGTGGTASVFLAPSYLVAAKSSELPARLRGCFEYLKQLEQVDAEKLPAGLENAASQLLHESLCRSKYEEVRVLTAQCFVELLRLYAPTPPYSGDDIKVLLDLTIDVLSHLKNGGQDEEESSFEGAAHVLESLDTVRSVCLLAEMANEKLEAEGGGGGGGGGLGDEDEEDAADRQIVALFTTLFTSVGEQTPKAVEERSNAVIGHVIDELAVITTPVVQALLMPLLNKEAEPRQAEACMAVLRRSEAKLAMPIAQTLLQFHRYAEAAAEAKKAMAVRKQGSSGAGGKGKATKGKKKAAGKKRKSDDDDDDGDEESEEEDEDEAEDSEEEANRLLSGASSSDAATLQAAKALGPFARPEVLQTVMVEVSVVIPGALMTLIPSLERELERPETAPRTFAVAVLGRLFGVRGVTVQASEAGLTGRLPIARAYGGAFKSWLRRFFDQDPRIRKQMCVLGSEVMRAHHTQTQGIVDLLAVELTKRLSDPDDEVRLQAVINACDCACGILDHVPRALVDALAGRTHDKKVEIRREACTGLAQAYAARMPAIWKREQAFAMDLGHREELRQAIGDAAEAAGVMEEASASSAPRGKKGVSAPSASASHSPLTVGNYLLSCPEPGAIHRLDLSGGERDALNKLAFIPDRVLPCFDHPEPEVKARVTQLADQVLLPEAVNMLGDAARSRGLLMLYASLAAAAANSNTAQTGAATATASKAETAFWRLQTTRRDAQKAMAAFLQARQALKDFQQQSTSRPSAGSGAGAGKKAGSAAAASAAAARAAGDGGDGRGGGGGGVSEDELKARLNKAISDLADRASGGSAAAKAKAILLFATLAHHVQDNRLFKQLAVLSSAGVTSQELAKAKEELLSRLKMVAASSLSAAAKASSMDSSSAFSTDLKAVAEATRVFMRKMAMQTLTASMVPCLIQAIHETALQRGRTGTAARGLELLHKMFSLFPELVARLVEAARMEENIVAPAGAGTAAAGDANGAGGADEEEDEEEDVLERAEASSAASSRGHGGGRGGGHGHGGRGGGGKKGGAGSSSALSLTDLSSTAELEYARLNSVRRAFVRLAALTGSLNPDIAIGALRAWTAVGGGGGMPVLVVGGGNAASGSSVVVSSSSSSVGSSSSSAAAASTAPAAIRLDGSRTTIDALLPEGAFLAFRARLLRYATSASPLLAKHSVVCACHVFSLGPNGGASSSSGPADGLNESIASVASRGGRGGKGGKKGSASAASSASSATSASSSNDDGSQASSSLSLAAGGGGGGLAQDRFFDSLSHAFQEPAAFDADGNENLPSLLAAAAALAKHAPAVFLRIDEGVSGNEDAGRYFRSLPPSSSSSSSSGGAMPSKQSFGGGIVRAALSFVDGTATTAFALGGAEGQDDDEQDAVVTVEDTGSEDEEEEEEDSDAEDEGFRKKTKKKGAAAKKGKKKATAKPGQKRRRKADSDDEDDDDESSEEDEDDEEEDSSSDAEETSKARRAPAAKRARKAGATGGASATAATSLSAASPPPASKDDANLHSALKSREASLYKGRIAHSPASAPFTLLRILSFKLLGAVSRSLATVVLRARALVAAGSSSAFSSAAASASGPLAFARFLAANAISQKEELEALELRVRSTVMVLGYELGAALSSPRPALSAGNASKEGGKSAFDVLEDDEGQDDEYKGGALAGKVCAPPYDAASRCAAVIQWLRVVGNSRLEASIEPKALSPQGYVALAQFLAGGPSSTSFGDAAGGKSKAKHQQQVFVREAVFKVLFEKLRAVQLPLRYLPLPMMTAFVITSPSERKKVKERLTMACESYRRAYHQASAATGAGANPNAPYVFLPEYSLPYAIFLLAHDEARMSPLRDALNWLSTARRKQGSAAEGKKEGGSSSSGGGGGGESTDFGPLKGQASCLTLLGESILGSWTPFLAGSSGGGGGGGGGVSASSLSAAATSKCSGSLSLLLTMLGVRVRETADAVDHTKTQLLHAISDLAYIVFRAYGRQQAAFVPYAGEIRFPTTFFRSVPRPGQREGGGSSSSSGGGGAGHGSSSAVSASSSASSGGGGAGSRR